MKLLPRITPTTKKVDTREPLGHGFDAAIVIIMTRATTITATTPSAMSMISYG